MQRHDLFTAGDVRRLVGVTQRQLTYWDQSSLVHPCGRTADGAGSRRLYTLQDVCRLKLVRRLRGAGISLQKIRQALRGVLWALADLADDPAPLAELAVLADSKRLLIRRSDDLLLDPLAGQFDLRLSFAELLEAVRTEAPLLFAPDDAAQPRTPASAPHP